MTICCARVLGARAIVSRSPACVQPVSWSGEIAVLLSSLSRAGRRIRLFHPIEESALLAAAGALSSGGIPVPLRGGEHLGIALGVDEGIDQIKADHWLALMKDGPIGASPLTFPFTSPNAIAAQVSIALDIRGEFFTTCGGQLAGAVALGLAVEAVRGGRAQVMLAGGATYVGRALLDGLATAGKPDAVGERIAAVVLAIGLAEKGKTSEEARESRILGFCEGFGETSIRDAAEGCLEEGAVHWRDVACIYEASPFDPSVLKKGPFRSLGIPRFRSPSADLFSASFPAAVVEVAENLERWRGQRVLVLGSDCMGAAAAALVRCGN